MHGDFFHHDKNLTVWWARGRAGYVGYTWASYYPRLIITWQLSFWLPLALLFIGNGSSFLGALFTGAQPRALLCAARALEKIARSEGSSHSRERASKCQPRMKSWPWYYWPEVVYGARRLTPTSKST